MYHTKEILYDLHYNKKLSSLKIALIYGVNSRTVRTWFCKYDIDLIGNTFQKGTPNDKNKIKSDKELSRIRTINIGRIPVNKGIGDSEFTCIVCKKICVDKKYRRLKYCSAKCRDNSKGETHWRYKGIENRSNQNRRCWKEYKDFKKAVHIRDNNICRICLNKGEDVHHIDAWKDNKILRNDPSNGLLLCKKCHKDVHSICGRNNYSKEKFIANYTFIAATNTWVRSALTTW